MPEARTDSETAKKAQALREAAKLGCTGAHRHPDGTWMACSTMEEYERLTNGEKEKSALDLVEETQKIRSQKGRSRKRKNKRQWDKLRERGVVGIDTLPGGGLVSGKGMTFRPVDGDTDVFDNINQARRRARQLGCIGVSRRISRSGRRVWPPCTNMTDYARATGSTALGRRYQRRLERQAIRNIVREELSKLKRRKKSLFDEVYESKGLGRQIGRTRRAVAAFDPNAWDGDNDGIVQEGTPFERPAIPGINTNLPGQQHTRQKPSSYPKDKPSRLEGMRSSRIMRGRNWDEEPDDIDDAPPVDTLSGRMRPGDADRLEFERIKDPTPDDRPMGTGPGERLPGRDELRRMSGPQFKQWLADEREKIGITDTSHPAYPHPALTHREHFIDTQMVPVDFFDDVKGADITDPSELARLKSEIETDGIKEPIKLYYDSKTGVVNLGDGNLFTAAKELGLSHVPVRISTTTRTPPEGKETIRDRLRGMDGGKPSDLGIPTQKIPASTETLRLMQSMYGGSESPAARRMRERNFNDKVWITPPGLRSTRQSEAVNAPLDKTTMELSETYKRPDFPLKPDEPIAVQHATRSVTALERIAEDRFRLPREQEEGARGGLDQVGLGGLYFTFEGDMIGADWDVEDEGSGEGSWMQMDTLVAAQITPKRPLTLITNDNGEMHPDSILKQLGFKTFKELEAAQVKRAKELDVDLEEARERSIAGVIPELLGIDLIVTKPVGAWKEDHQSGDLVVLDSDIIETVGVRQIGKHPKTHSWTHREDGSYEPDWNPESNASIRERVNKTIKESFEDQPNARGGMRSSRDSERIRRSPESNIELMESDIDAYLDFVAKHPNFDFNRYSAHDPGHKRTGGLNEYGLARLSTDEENEAWLTDWRSLPKAEQDLVQEHDELWEAVDDWATFISHAQSERENVEWDLEELLEELEKTRTYGGSRPYGISDENEIVMAIANGEDRDTFIEREFGPFETNQEDLAYGGSDDPEFREDKYGRSVWNDYTYYWDDVVERRDEAARIQGDIDFLQEQLEKYHVNGTEDAQKLYREALVAKLAQRPDSKPVQDEITRGRVALDPAQGMRSRREKLSPREKDWLKLLQDNPEYWHEAPATVRSVASQKLRDDSRIIRTGGMRSSRNVGGRVMGQRILGKVKPEHRNKKDRTLYFVGGTTGAGKSTVIKDGSVTIPGETEAAHIDPDFIKTGLDGWDPNFPGRVHKKSRDRTDEIMGDAMNSGMDMVVQGTGKRTEHLREARERGYETVGHFVYIPGTEADKRIAQRTEAGGPNIPVHFGSLIAGELRNGIVSRQITNGLYDEFYLWDNTGDTLKLVAFRNKDGHFEIRGRAEFDDFFGASGRHVEKYWQQNQ